ncbi:1086_t:CDS:2, partial [Dentiscutata erythropus]
MSATGISRVLALGAKRPNPPKQKELASEYNISEQVVSDNWWDRNKWLQLEVDSYDAQLKKECSPGFSMIEEAKSIASNIGEQQFCSSSIFWKQKPKRTLATNPQKGHKIAKECVICLIACNTTSNQKLKLAFIHKYKTSRSLRNINYNRLPVSYFWNKTCWMQ